MEERKEMLLATIKANVAPVLIETELLSAVKNIFVLPANIDVKKLNGHYEGTEYLPPKWFANISDGKVLVIDRIDSIPKEEQYKFVEILEYRKVSTFDLPKDCAIVLTADNISKDTISEEIFSLVARI